MRERPNDPGPPIPGEDRFGQRIDSGDDERPLPPDVERWSCAACASWMLGISYPREAPPVCYCLECGTIESRKHVLSSGH